MQPLQCAFAPLITPVILIRISTIPSLANCWCFDYGENKVPRGQQSVVVTHWPRGLLRGADIYISVSYLKGPHTHIYTSISCRPEVTLCSEASFIFIHSLVFSLSGRAGRNQTPVMWPVWLWHTGSWASSWGVVCHCFPPPLDVPTFAARYLYVRNDARDPSSEGWNCGRESCPLILPKFRLPRKFRDILHAANPRHGTDGFTSPPKEGVLRIVFAKKKEVPHRLKIWNI